MNVSTSYTHGNPEIIIIYTIVRSLPGATNKEFHLVVLCSKVTAKLVDTKWQLKGGIVIKVCNLAVPKIDLLCSVLTYIRHTKQNEICDTSNYLLL